MKRVLIYVYVIFPFLVLSQQNMGIGTLNPRTNAILDIESNDKGLLIPRLTTGARTTLATALSIGDNGMLVYDKDLNFFYYWDGSQWIFVGSDNQNITAFELNSDSTITITIEDGNTQVLDISNAYDNTDAQILSIIGDSLKISNGNSVYLSDNDSMNEKIDSVRYKSDTLTIYEGNKQYKEEIVGGEWTEGSKVGLTNNDIYARRTLNNGDTVVVTETGEMGIGLSNPMSLLHLKGGLNNQKITIQSDLPHTDPLLNLWIGFNDANNQNFGWIGEGSGQRKLSFVSYFNNAISMEAFEDNINRVGAIFINNNANKNILFNTKNINRATIDSNGRLGVTTTSPRAFFDNASLEVDSIKSILARLPEGDGTGKGTYLGVYSHNSQPAYIRSFSIQHRFHDKVNASINFFRGGSSNNGFLTFNTDNETERMRITHQGNVGIGTTTPATSALLELSSANQGFLITRSDPNTILNPLFGLQTLSPVDSCLYMYNGTQWIGQGGVGAFCSCNCYSPPPVVVPLEVRNHTWNSGSGALPRAYNIQNPLSPSDLALVTDNDPNTFITTLEQDYGCFSTDMGSNVTLTSIVIVPSTANGFGGAFTSHPGSFAVFGSTDGITWIQTSVSMTPTTGVNTKTFTLDGVPYRYYSVRFNVCNSCTNYLADIQFNL